MFLVKKKSRLFLFFLSFVQYCSKIPTTVLAIHNSHINDPTIEYAHQATLLGDWEEDDLRFGPDM